MKVYPTENLRNIAFVSHNSAGKTSLIEAMLFKAGMISRIGRVEEGNTTTDYLPEEISRKVTVSLALAPCEWRETKINIIDTPGYADFFGEVQSALRVTDGVVMIVCASSGVEVQTEVIWDYAQEKGLPRLLFLNKMDRENANFAKVLDEMRSSFGSRVIPLQLPIGSAENFEGIIDLLQEKAFIYEDGKRVAKEIPQQMKEEVAQYHTELLEALAEADDELLMRYLEGEEIKEEEYLAALKKGIKETKIFPVLCGSALKNIGTDFLLDACVDLFSDPTETINVSPDKSSSPKAFVFKTISDPYVGRINIFRLYQGNLKAEDALFNLKKNIEEKFNQIFILRGKNQENVPEISFGDIGALTKLQATTTNDTLAGKKDDEPLPEIEFLEPVLPMAIFPKSKGDEDKLGNALARLLEEDPTLKIERNTETKENIIYALGEAQLEVLKERLKKKFGVEVELAVPTVPYRETIRKKISRIEGKYKKQTGGHGQYGHVFIDIEPYPEEEFKFEESIFGGAVPRQYIPAVEKGIREALNSGVLAGYPVTNIKVNLVDGSYHPVDSSEMAFKIASAMAFKKAMEQANPVILEPIMKVEVRVPEQFMGDIIGDLNSRRGKILGMEPEGKWQVIHALVPLAEMYRYAIDLKAMTQGRGRFKMEFNSYEEMPGQLQEKIIAEAKSKKEQEE